MDQKANLKCCHSLNCKGKPIYMCNCDDVTAYLCQHHSADHCKIKTKNNHRLVDLKELENIKFIKQKAFDYLKDLNRARYSVIQRASDICKQTQNLLDIVLGDMDRAIFETKTFIKEDNHENGYNLNERQQLFLNRTVKEWKIEDPCFNKILTALYDYFEFQKDNPLDPKKINQTIQNINGLSKEIEAKDSKNKKIQIGFLKRFFTKDRNSVKISFNDLATNSSILENPIPEIKNEDEYNSTNKFNLSNELELSFDKNSTERNLTTELESRKLQVFEDSANFSLPLIQSSNEMTQKLVKKRQSYCKNCSVRHQTFVYFCDCDLCKECIIKSYFQMKCIKCKLPRLSYFVLQLVIVFEKKNKNVNPTKIACYFCKKLSIRESSFFSIFKSGHDQIICHKCAPIHVSSCSECKNSIKVAERAIKH